MDWEQQHLTWSNEIIYFNNVNTYVIHTNNDRYNIGGELHLIYFKIKTALNLQSTFVLTVYERVKTFPKITKYNLASC